MGAPDQAITGWTRYVQLATRDLPADAPVDERMAMALAGEELPYWLEDGIRIRLVGSRTRALAVTSG